MKTILFTTIFVCIFLSMQAQEQENIRFGGYDDQEVKTIFKKEKRDGFYGSFSAAYSPINNEDGMTVSARGCWIMDHFFSFGVGGTAFINAIDEFPWNYYPSGQSDSKATLAGGYGGLILEPIIFPLFPVHLSLPVLVGVGGISQFDNLSYYSTYYLDDVFWVVEPTAELEINFTKWLRIAFFGSYRFTSSIEIENVSPNALKGYSAGITLKMGVF